MVEQIGSIVAVVVVGVSMLTGYRKGLLASALDLLSVVCGILAIVFLTRPFGEWLEEKELFSGAWSFLVAPSLLLAVTFFVFKILSLVLARRSRDEDDRPDFPFLGALVNGTAGVFYAALLVWGISVARTLAAPEASAARRPTVEVFAGRLVGGIAASTLKVALPEERLAPPAAASFAADPQGSLKSVEAIVESETLGNLIGDASFQELLDRKDLALIRKDPRFQALFDDPALQGAFDSLGLLGTKEKREQLEEHLAKTLGVVWSIHARPEVQEILLKPDFRAAAERRDVLALLRNPDTLRLLKLVLAEAQ